MKAQHSAPVGAFLLGVAMARKTGDQREDRQRSRLYRVVSVLGGLLILVVVALVLMNAGAGSSSAASSDDTAEAQADAETQEGEDEEKAAVPVSIAVAKGGSVSSYITSTANLVAEFEVTVLAEADGRVSQLLADEGRAVRSHQILATMVRDDAEIALNKARLKETNASLAYQRAEELMGQELISREDFDRFTMDYEIARQELAEAEWKLEKTTIRAPFAGRVTERIVQAGEHVRPGDELFRVTDFDPLIARIYLPERDILGLAEGRQVRFTLNADSDVRFGGRICQISPVVDTETGTVKLTIEAVSPPPAVRPGSFVTIGIVRETHPEAVLLPREAVLRELQKAHVFVAQGDTAEKRAVTLGMEEEGWIEAVSGVDVGERVIVAGQGGLKDGSAIKVLGAEPSQEG
jgi:membrane fusion protein (multidrug efflux system)